MKFLNIFSTDQKWNKRRRNTGRENRSAERKRSIKCGKTEEILTDFKDCEQSLTSLHTLLTDLNRNPTRGCSVRGEKESREERSLICGKLKE